MININFKRKSLLFFFDSLCFIFSDKNKTLSNLRNIFFQDLFRILLYIIYLFVILKNYLNNIFVQNQVCRKCHETEIGMITTKGIDTLCHDITLVNNKFMINWILENKRIVILMMSFLQRLAKSLKSARAVELPQGKVKQGSDLLIIALKALYSYQLEAFGINLWIISFSFFFHFRWQCSI